MISRVPDVGLDQTEMRKQVLSRFAGLFERQVRARQYAQSVNALVQTTHAEVMDLLQQAVGDLDFLALDQSEKSRLATKLASAVGRFSRLDATLDLLLSHQLQQWQFSQEGLRHVMMETNRTARNLSVTLVEKALFERHAQILESIVLSHEKVTYWDQHVRDILSQFRAIIAVSAFFVAFEEDGKRALHMFYLETCADGCREQLRERVLDAALADTPDRVCEIYEITVCAADAASCEGLTEIPRLIVAPIPQLDTATMNGLLGIVHARGAGMSEQEASVIRSVLSVMVMVVGSSKALGRTLSELEYFSTHDSLTGLFNRRYFNDVLQSEQARSQRHGHEFSVLLIDLDDFKDINDTYGHPCGDQVLMRVADVIHLPMRVGDFSARIGGDEFAVILTETSAAGAKHVAEKLRKQIRELIFSCEDGREFRITASIGVSTYPASAQSLSDLIAGADHSLYQAKKQGKDGVISLASVQDVVKFSRFTRDYAEKLRASLISNRVIPHYQPIVHCRDGSLFAYEALARIREADGTLISAGAFIEAAEKYGLIRDFDRVIIRHAFADLVEHIAVHGLRFQLFLNLSAQEIQSRGVLNFAEQLCIEMGVPPNTVVFEITERDAINDMAHMRTFLRELRAKGFLFALDDFGSGYNSFHYLRELTFDYVKIDGAFVRNILESRADQILVHNLSRLCQDLGIRTIAEFVESEATLTMLRDMGIDYAQGYHVGMPAAGFH